MPRLRPEDLNLSALQRSPLGHLKADAVGDLLQRAAWDYRETLAENQRLTRTVEELGRRVEELTKQVASLEEVAARRKDPDELARSLLASAQRAAREERESARREGELILRKAAQRADKLDENVARREADRLSEIARLETLRDELLTRLRRMLETLASRYEATQYGRVEPDEAVAAGKQQ
jgi:cell division septum initiation protein DivIVA